jgi:predicted component of type VI protein secretion system
MKNLKIDAPFLSKFNRQSIYITSETELYQSIIEEIGNILSSKLRVIGDYRNPKVKDSPFCYGVRDLQSIGTSSEEMEEFKLHCRTMILNFEPRIQDIEITKIFLNRETQNLRLDVTCFLKNGNRKFSTEISISS